MKTIQKVRDAHCDRKLLFGYIASEIRFTIHLVELWLRLYELIGTQICIEKMKLDISEVQRAGLCRLQRLQDEYCTKGEGRGEKSTSLKVSLRQKAV